jgi:hypothetical protein
MDNIKHGLTILAQALSLENDRKKRRVLLQRLQKKLSQISAIEDRVISPKEAYDGDYWRSRADQTLRLAKRHRNTHVRLHFAKIADGYLELAKRADGVQRADHSDP